LEMNVPPRAGIGKGGAVARMEQNGG